MSEHGKLSELQIGAYRLSPSVWADRELKPRLGLDLDQWQRKLVSAPRGSRQGLLTYRQSGKSTAAAVAASHSMIFRPGSTSLAIAPSQRQSAEVARRARAILIATGQKLTVDNLFELGCNGSRLVALPGSSDDTVRGLSVDAELIIDEAARVDDEIYNACRPMIARHAGTARLLVMSTAWLSSGFFHDIWTNGSEQSVEHEDWSAIVRSLLGNDPTAELLTYHDAANGRHRFVSITRGRLAGALYLAREPVAVSRNWLVEQLADGQAESRHALLAGRPGKGQPDRGAIVCSCFGVSASQIAAAVRHGRATVETIGAALQAGTNCGSCRAEINTIIAANRRAAAE